MKFCNGCLQLERCDDGFYPSEKPGMLKKCVEYRAYMALSQIWKLNPLFFEPLESGMYNFDRTYFYIDYGKKTCIPIPDFEKFLEIEVDNLLEGKKRLIISGDMGTGKTTLALYFMRILYMKLYRNEPLQTGCYIASSSKFYEEMQNEGISRAMLYYPLLLIDDLFIDTSKEKPNFRIADWGKLGFFQGNTKLLFEEANGFFVITSNLKPTDVPTKNQDSPWITQTLDRIRWKAVGIHVEGSSKRAGGKQ